jgi:hypothetical protein
VSGPAHLVNLAPDHLALQVVAPGVVTVRVRYTKFWSITQGSGCIAPDSAGWTAIQAASAGRLALSASVLHPSQPPSCPSTFP